MKVLRLSIYLAVFAVTSIFGLTAAAGVRAGFNLLSSIVKTPVAAERPIAKTESAFIEPAIPDDSLVNLQTAQDFDPTGTYYLGVVEEVPKAFADIQYLELTIREYSSENGSYFNKPIVPNGSIQTNKKLTFERFAVGNREISFQTATVDGVSYKFTGHFPVADTAVSCEKCEYPADLKGRLTKIKDGKWVAEMEAKFYVAGC